MSIEVAFESRCRDGERAEHFHRLTTAVAAPLAGVAQRSEVPPTEITVVFADDFVTTVDELLATDAARAGRPHQTFTTDRVGGTVAAKNIPMSADGAHIAVVVNADQHHFVAPELEAHSIFLIAHELTHPLLTRLRAASQAMETMGPPATDAAANARGIVRAAVDEYRADRIADVVLGALASITIDGQTRPMRMTDLFGGAGHRDYLPEILDGHVHPGWPGLVQDYREHRIPLEDLYRRLIVSTDQTLTALAHAEAEAAVADEPSALGENCAEHPGAVLYLGPAWSQIMDTVDGQPLLPALGTFAALEHDLLDTGEQAVLDMWQKLGLTATPLPSGADYLHVGAPLR